MKLSDYYILTYANDVDQESQKNERKKVQNLIRKFEKSPEVFRGLAFDYISVEEQARIVHFFLEECEQRQIIDNLTKINADANFSSLEIDKHMESKVQNFDTNCNSLCNDNAIRDIREKIRKTSDNLNELLEYLLYVNDQVFRAFVKGDALHEINGCGYVTYYIDFILDGILQFLLYPIMMYSPNIDPLKVIDQLTEKTDGLMKKIDDSIGQKYETIFGTDGLKADRIISYFRSFIEHRNRLFENSDIYKVLIKEMEKYPELFSDVPDMYRAPKKTLTEEEINSDKFKTVVTENRKVPNFKKKVENTREFINVMRIYGGRDCFDTYLQDIKVYFREIYMSKQTYHRQKTAKIVDDYMTQVRQAQEKGNVEIPEFKKKSQYIFVREKISRGYFREKNFSAVYVGKVELTEKLNTMLLRAYWVMDSKAALELLHEYNKELLLCYSDFLR